MLLQILIITFIFIILYFIYVYKKMHYHFDKHGIKYIAGLPLFGNVFKSSLLYRHTVEDVDAVYNAFPDERYVGYLEGTRRIVMIRDPDLIKLITVKDFDCFMSKKKFFPVEIFPLLGSGLFSMEGGETWRQMRTHLSPSFTGAKLRFMMPFMTKICKDYMEYLKDKESEDLDVMDVVYRYSNDIFASTAFGIQINSVKDRYNKFYLAGQDTVTLTFWKRLWFYLATQSRILAKILQFLGAQMLSKETVNFFKDVVTENIEYRKKNNIKRPDMLHFLMEASEVAQWTPDDITGQAFSFFLAGFESSSSSITLCIHELAVNPDFQEKLYEEIRTYAENNENLTYESLNELKYLSCVLNEASRKWSAALFLDRVCTKKYELPPPRKGGKSYQLYPGDLVYNAVNSLHFDPKYYPDPEMFNPDRFLDENKHQINPFTFMPFGMGPRNCIGIRFAELQMKIFIYYLILNFKIVKCEKTSDPIRLMANEITIKAIGSTWVQIESRQ